MALAVRQWDTCWANPTPCPPVFSSIGNTSAVIVTMRLASNDVAAQPVPCQ